MPVGVSYADSRPQANVTGRTLEWHLGEIGAQQTKTIRLDLRADSEGRIDLCATMRTSEGLTAQDCVTTQAMRAALDVRITGPTRAEVGTNVRFQIVVTNRGGAMATDLIITDSFDDGLEHLVAESPIERSLEQLGPGKSSSIYVNFRVTKPGELCHTVEVAGKGGLQATARACVTATEPAASAQPAIDVKKTGPRRRQVGEKAEFKILVKNTGNVPLTNLRITDTYEQALMPTDATAGFDEPALGDEKLVWQVARLGPGQAHSVEVHCNCEAPAERACNRVVVTCDQRPPIADETCLEILSAGQPPPGPAERQPVVQEPLPSELRMTIADLGDPVRTGDLVTYQVLVTNQGSTAETDVGLTIRFPEALTPQLVGTRFPVPYRVEGQALRFEAVKEILGGQPPLTFRIPFGTRRAGTVRVLAELTSPRLPSPLTDEETTEILEEDSLPE
jgi:uncharacterized repeat protein (TIGR01451 family)